MEEETPKSVAARSAVCKQLQCVNFISYFLFCFSWNSEEEEIAAEDEKADILIESPTSLSSLGADALAQIFHKLPIGCVVRCTAVCKLWRCLISNPMFKSSFNHTNQPLTLIPFPSSPCAHPAVYQYEIDGSEYAHPPPLAGHPWPIPLKFNIPVTRITVLGSYNGLVALHHVTADWNRSHCFNLLNPITKEEKLVLIHSSDIEFRHHFPYYHSYKCTASGLCHDPANNEYKVVVTIPDHRCSYGTILLVSFTDDSWKIRTNSLPDSFKDPEIPGFFRIGTTAQGAPYWICHPDPSRAWGQNPVICYFDWQGEVLRVAQLPMGIETDPAFVCGLGALDGKLTVALTEERWIGEQCRVWALNEYGNDDSWSFLFSMPLDSYRGFRLLSWRKDEWVVYASCEGVVIRGVSRMQTSVRQLEFSSRSCYIMNVNNMVTYFPSFASPITHCGSIRTASSESLLDMILSCFEL